MVGHHTPGIGDAERRRLAWHLPDDFDQRPAPERETILEWVRTVIISGSTDYRRFQAAAIKYRYAVQFPGWDRSPNEPPGTLCLVGQEPDDDEDSEMRFQDPELMAGNTVAPPPLAEEMTSLIRFKSSKLTALGYQRSGVWGSETVGQKIEHFGLMLVP